MIVIPAQAGILKQNELRFPSDSYRIKLGMTITIVDYVTYLLNL